MWSALALLAGLALVGVLHYLARRRLGVRPEDHWPPYDGDGDPPPYSV